MGHPVAVQPERGRARDVDEPTSDLDTDTAAGIAAMLHELAGAKTIVVATHDPALATLAKRTIRIEAGVVADADRT